MTRFYMTLDQSVELIITALLHGESGDTFIPKINSFKIIDLANYFSLKCNKPIRFIPIRAGEKIHECLINQTEICRTDRKIINGKTYFVIKPCYKNYNFNNRIEGEYTSDKYLDFEGLKALLEF